MSNDFKLTDTQKEYVLQLFEELLPKEIKTTPYFIGNGLIQYDENKPPIHWFELVFGHLAERVFPTLYWADRFNSKTLLHLTRTEHPVDFMYEKYQKVKNKENLFEPMKHEYVAKIEEKEQRKAEKAKEAKDPKPKKTAKAKSDLMEDLFE